MSAVERNGPRMVAGPGGDPRLGCDQPLGAGSLYFHNTLLLTGWAVAPGGIAAVEVEIEGRTWSASYGHPSPDIAAAIGGAEHARFEVRVETERWAREMHQLKLRARSSGGDVAELSGSVCVEPYEEVSWRYEEQRARLENGMPVMSCDVDLSGEAAVRLPWYLLGWADAQEGIARVSVFVNGCLRIEAATGVPRPDLLGRMTDRLDVGFRALLEGDAIGSGRHSIVTIAYPIEGDPVGMSGWLDLIQPAIGYERGLGQSGGNTSADALPLPSGAIDEPVEDVTEATFTRVSGWAIFDSETVSSVRLCADGRSLGDVRLGLPRRHLASVSSAADAPVCGFEIWLRPEDLTPGADHVTLEAEVLGTRGGRFALTPITRRIICSNTDGRVDLNGEPERVLRVQGPTRHSSRRTRRKRGARLLAVSHQLSRTGAPLYLLELLPRLLADGIECTVVSAEDGPLRREFESAGIPVHVSYMSRPDAVAYESKLWELTAWAAPQGFDIVHVNTIDSFLGTDLAVRLGIPAIWAIHEGLAPDYWLAINRWSPDPHVWERMAGGFQTAAAVLVATNEERAALAAYGRPGRLVTLPYGVDLQRIDRYREGLDRFALRQRLGFSANDTVLLSIATIEPRKAQTVMAQAFAALADLPSETILTLIGETGLAWTAPYVEGLREFVHRRGMSSQIKIVPVTEDYYEWLAIADIFVAAADIEFISLAVLEAMAFELPVVSTKASGIPRAARDGISGFLCEPCDVSDLSGALARALALTPRARRDVGRRGAEVVRSGYDVRRYAAQYSSLVLALVADPETLPAEILASDQRTDRAGSSAL